MKVYVEDIYHTYIPVVYVFPFRQRLLSTPMQTRVYPQSSTSHSIVDLVSVECRLPFTFIASVML